jgi:hypothetical protein
MSDEEQRLIEEARRSREESRRLREEGATEQPEDEESPDGPGNPWAKTSSGDADSITDDE